MVKEQIIINGIYLDMPAQAVQLSVQSNLLGKVDDLTASYSYTIKLPRTLNNDKALEQAWDVVGNSTKIYTWLPCSYLREGMHIFDGKLVVTSISSDGYSCNLVWGFDALATLKDDGLKLWQLATGSSHYGDWVYLNADPQPNQYTYFVGNAVYGYADYTSGLHSTFAAQAELPRMLPCVTARYILNLISERYGITLDLPTYADEIVDKMVIALTSKYAYREDNYPQTTWELTTEKDPDTAIWSYNLSPVDTGQGIIFHHMVGGVMRWTPMVDSTIKDLDIYVSCGERFYISSAKFGTITSTSQEAGTGRWFIHYEATDVDVVANTNMEWEIGVEQDTPTHGWIASLEGSYEFKVVPTKTEMVVGSGYPIVCNLPEISCMDFFGELFAITGVVPVGMNGNTLRCINWSALMDAPIKMDVLGISTLSTRASNLAQKNVLKYNTDEWQTDANEGSLNVSDTTLQSESEWHKSHFAAIGSLVNVPLYTRYYQDGEAQIDQHSIKERIALVKSVYGGFAEVTGEGIDFADVVATHYTTMQSAITKPKVVEVQARMASLQFAQLDCTKAVYVEQLASYFAILEVENNEGDIYDVKMIKL